MFRFITSLNLLIQNFFHLQGKLHIPWREIHKTRVKILVKILERTLSFVDIDTKLTTFVKGGGGGIRIRKVRVPFPKILQRQRRIVHEGCSKWKN